MKHISFTARISANWVLQIQSLGSGRIYGRFTGTNPTQILTMSSFYVQIPCCKCSGFCDFLTLIFSCHSVPMSFFLIPRSNSYDLQLLRPNSTSKCSHSSLDLLPLILYHFRAVIAQSVWRWATGCTIGVLGLDSRRGLGIFSSPPRPERLWGPPSLLPIGYWGFFPWG
jgi:hypothetical protein